MFRLLSAFPIAAMLFPVAATAARRPDINAFLDFRVTSERELVLQVKNDRQVRDRYERHFGMTDTELYGYLTGLHLTKLPAAETFTIYSVPEDGRVKVHVEKLPKNTSVFVDATNRPILVLKCGNPVTLGPSNTRNVALEVPDLADNPDLELQTLPDLAASPVPMVDPNQAVAIIDPPDTIDDIVSVPPTTTTVATTPPVAAVAPPITLPSTAPVASGSGFNGLALLPILGGGALIGVLASHHGGGGPIAPVPEPAPVVALVAGVALLMKRSPK